jgi:hypothetical protein
VARIQRIKEIIGGKLPSYNSAFVQVRGLAFPLDIFLAGRARFARKLGEVLSIWIADNATTLAAPVTTYDTKLVLDEVIPWVVPGSKLRLGNQVFVFVEDITDAGFGILLTETPITRFEAGSEVELYAHPLQMNVSYAATPENPEDFISVLSDHKIYPGDIITVGSYEHDVTEVILVNTREDGRFQYQLTLATGITSSLNAGSYTDVYLRAYPAYESLPLRTPTLPTTVIGSVGPFLFDRVSGELFTDLNIEEIDIVTTYDTSGAQITTSKLTKNAVIYGASISPDMFLFWDKVRGKIQWDGNRKAFKAITDTKGVFQLHNMCVPVIPPGQVTRWLARIEATVETRMVVELEPNSPQVFIIPAGTSTSVAIEFPLTNKPIERIHIVFDTGSINPEAAVYMKSWETNTPSVGFISHATIAKVTGRFLWGSSGAFAKPYFLKLDYIRAQADLLAKLDSGLIAS